MSDHTERNVISILTNMRLNPQAYERAHVLMPLYEIGIEFLDYVLVQ